MELLILPTTRTSQHNMPSLVRVRAADVRIRSKKYVSRLSSLSVGSPRSWHYSAGHADLTGLGNDPFVYSRCNFSLKLINDVAETHCSSTKLCSRI